MASNGLDHRTWVLSVIHELEAPLTRYAQRITRDDDLARDVVQYAFLRLCDDLAGGQNAQTSIQNVRQWLYAVCRNRAIDMLRRNKRMQTYDSRTLDGRGAVDDDAAPFSVNGHARQADPVAVAEAHESAALVRKILATLPEPQQEVVELWADGFSYSEISEITNRTEINVRVMMHRAFKAVREHPWAKELLAK